MTNFIGYDMQDYKGMTDEQLQSLAAGGDAQAEEILIERYTRLVRVCARPYFLAGGDSEDLTQEGLMGPPRGGARILGSERLTLPRLRRGLHTQPDSTSRQIRIEKEARPAQRRSLPGICNPLRRRIRASSVYPARALPAFSGRAAPRTRERERILFHLFAVPVLV